MSWQSFRFINGKTEACFHMKRNPRKLSWTLFYRRLRKKGTQEDVLKKAKKRIVTSSAMTRGIAGLSIDELKAKKSEAPERRKAMREATVRYTLFSAPLHTRDATVHACPLLRARDGCRNELEMCVCVRGCLLSAWNAELTRTRCRGCSSAKDENRKKQEEKKKNAPKKVAGGAAAPMSKMGMKGGAVIQPGRSSAPGKKSTR